MEKNINIDAETKFTTYMLLFTFGIIILHILISPFFHKITVPFFIERTIRVQKENQLLPIKNLKFNGLPAIYYQYYDNNTNVNLNFVNTINNNLLKSLEFEIYLFNDKDARHFIISNFDDKLLNIYDKLTNKQKINLWIYCLLYSNGGIYININLKLKKSLINIINDNIKLDILFTKQGSHVSNKFIVAKPNHPIFKELIDSYYTDDIKTLSSIVFDNYNDNIKFTVDKKYNIRNIETDEILFEPIRY
jgi:mannosyltransferase OCH1-like enzyme